MYFSFFLCIFVLKLTMINIPSFYIINSNYFTDVLDLTDKFPNDAELGAEIRNLISKYKNSPNKNPHYEKDVNKDNNDNN